MPSQHETLKRKIDSLARTAASSQSFRIAMLRKLREAIPFDAACCTLVDPQTLLSTGAVTEEGVESIHQALFANEYLEEDVNRFIDLALEADPVASLHGTTEGQPERSARYRNVLHPAGFRDEMRAVLVFKGGCYGYLTLFRLQAQPVFHERERSLLSSLVPAIAFHLRSISMLLPEDGAGRSEEQPGILIVSESLAVLSSNEASEHWLSMLRKWENTDIAALPKPVQAVCFRALSESGEESASTAKVCMRTPEGRYMTIRASKLTSSTRQIQLAVWFEQAAPSDVLPVIVESHGLSEREKRVLACIIQGQSTKIIARMLNISAYTVQDHLKSIFAKTGTSSRSELIWQLYSRFSPDSGF
jgi:DNA-binding CsgD family transcriptional regulator